MPNSYVNKVVANSVTKLDLTSDTVIASTLLQGYTAHDASGAPITGTVVDGDLLGYGVSTQPIVGTARVGATVLGA